MYCNLIDVHHDCSLRSLNLVCLQSNTVNYVTLNTIFGGVSKEIFNDCRGTGYSPSSSYKFPLQREKVFDTFHFPRMTYLGEATMRTGEV